MRTKLFLLSLLLTALSAYSQEYIFGKVRSEFGSDLPNAVIINTRTDEKVSSDKDGNYMISAKPSDELRFVKSGYERTSAKISIDNYSQPLNISLTQSAYLIEEVELAFQATGNLKKDVKSLDPPRRVVSLNSSMDSYMRTPPTESSPKLITPSAFAPKDFNAGQVDMVKAVSALVGLISKTTSSPITTANYAETQEFYRRVKTEIDLSFYTSRGWTEEDIDRFLIYADNSYSLARKYRKSFNISAITSDMKMAYQEYIKTHKVGT
ncbi:MAG: carboxypeptidase-like regulatory domain-containing protein [Flavobacteriales bacterium]|nr:carboxypeptidase-like regulatory domain-containing protein [Flavobacteriales bacterium]